MASDPVRIASYMVASSLVLTLVILFAASFRGGNAPSRLTALAVGTAISVVGILFGKFGATFGLPWQIYYSVPALATVLLPPLAFRFTLQRALGWDEYMPFLHLPRL